VSNNKAGSFEARIAACFQATVGADCECVLDFEVWRPAAFFWIGSKVRAFCLTQSMTVCVPSGQFV